LIGKVDIVYYILLFLFLFCIIYNKLWLIFINTLDKNILTLAQLVTASAKGIVETAIFLKNTLAPVVAGVAALAI
jgi:hypothetical protein